MLDVQPGIDDHQIGLRAARDAATERYGSLMGYINEALEVTPAEVELLRERYLT